VLSFSSLQRLNPSYKNKLVSSSGIKFIISQDLPIKLNQRSFSLRYSDKNFDCRQRQLRIYSKNDITTNNNDNKLKPVLGAVFSLVAIGVIALVKNGGIDFNLIINESINKISSLGVYGYLYFAAIYIAAEILAIPAMPLTASSGYLFGLVPGTFIVLSSATAAACISFYIGRTFFKTWAQKMISSSKRWKAIDKAITKEGFKVILLLRLSPLLPFAISNYIYGVTSVNFWSFLTATFLGFAPGTFGIVYAGSVGKAIFSENSMNFPWYVYLVIGTIVLYFGQTIAKIANDAINDMEKEM
jgi:uncharacterized membrane protein YdjX (TVP38/TMEM64 family)